MAPDRTMEPEPRLDPSARLRLVDVSLGAGRGQVRVAPGLTGILTGGGNRAGAARFLATTVAGPRPPECDASIDVDGEIVSVRTLPEPLLGANAPNLVDRDLLWARWQSGCAQRRDDLAATHASHRLEGYRIDAALERARAGSVTSGTSAPPAPIPDRGSASEAAPSGPDAAAADTPLRHQLQLLLADLAALNTGALAEGVLLADAWEALSLLVRVRLEVETEPGVDVDALERRVNEARATVEEHATGISPEVAAHIEHCHEAVLEKEAKAFAARRKDRARAIADFEEAVAAELVSLADAELESYAAFLEAVADAKSGPTLAERNAARAELAAARAALEAALQIPDVPTRAEMAEREARMRSRAGELLGHEPGEDLPFELRSLREESASRAEILEEIADALQEAGIDINGDVEAIARAQLGIGPSNVAQSGASGVPAAVAAEIEALELQQRTHHQALAEIEAELVRVDAAFHADITKLAASDASDAVDRLLGAYRAGELLNGQLPIVLDGAIDGLASAAREAAVHALATANDLQVIVVSEDPEVLQSVAHAGGMLVRWPEPLPNRGADAREPTRGSRG